MKKVFNIIAALTGIFLIIAPLTFLAPCNMEGAACVSLAKAAELVGIIVFITGITGAFLKEKISLIVSSVNLLVEGIVTLILPNYIGFCKMETMACVVKTVPGVRASAIVVIISAIILLVLSLKNNGGQENID